MEKLLKLALGRAEQAEVYVRTESSQSARFTNGVLKGISGSDTIGVQLRVIVDGRLGVATATSFEDREDLVKRAIESTRYGEPVKFRFPNAPAPNVKSFDPKVAEMSQEELVARGESVISRLSKLLPGVSIDGGIGNSVKTVKILNSSGFSGEYSATGFSLGVYTKSDKGFGQTGDWDESGKVFDFDDARIEEIAAKHRAADNRVTVPTGKYTVVFTPMAMWSLLLRLVAGVSGDAIAKSTSPIKEKLGEKIFDSRITVLDDPLMEYGLRSCAFDDEGVASRTKAIVENGVLKSFMFDLATAAEAGFEPTGNGFKRALFADDVEVKVSPQPTNFVLKPGDLSTEEIIRDIKEGIVVDSVMGGHTGNIVAGEFSLNIGSGFLVKDGKLVGKVMDAMVAGNIYDVFNQVLAIGSESRATRAVFYGMGYSPAVSFKDLVVACK